LAYLVHL